MTSKRNPLTDWLIWLHWTLVSTLGTAVGIALSLAAIGAVGEIVSSIAFGATVGLAQWLVLRKRFRRAGWWILATALGATLGFVATNAIHNALLGVSVLLVAGVLGFAALGLAVGIAQWWVLRNHLRRAGWWVLVSTAGWFLGGLAAWEIRLYYIEFIKIIADFAILGIITGASTGLVLILMMKRPAPLEDREISPIRNLAVAGCALILIIIASVGEHTGKNPNDLNLVPDLGTVPMCSDLPPLDCIGDDTYCSELVSFQPTTGAGYINYPANGETWDNQYRSYLGRDLMILIKYASAKVACETAGWDTSRLRPLGLGDMSEADGSIPGTSTGHPDHPWGTHQDGRDIDVAYFQKDSQNVWLKIENSWLGLEGDLLRSVCKYTRFGMDVYHCTEPPRLLDPWRTALFIAHLAESSQLRVIGVDGQVGPVLEDTLDQLAQAGWIDPDLREAIPLTYEVTDEGLGWFRFHNHHMHISTQSR